MLSADDPSLITSYELVARSLEDSIKYDNLSDADKSRARKQPLHTRQPGRRGGLKQRCLAGLRSIDLFWALTAASIGTFILIALALLYFRHSHNAFMHRFSHEELSRRRHHLGFDHIYVAQHADGGARWAEDAARMEIELQPWPVVESAPTATDARSTLLVQRACWHAHREIYRDIVSSGHMDALIIEDRVVAGPSARLRLYGALRGVPADWDVLHLGPPANSTDLGRHDDIAISGAAAGTLAYRRVDAGACDNLAYAVSLAGARKVLKMAEAHGDFEHAMANALERAQLLVFRITPAVFAWADESAGRRMQ